MEDGLFMANHTELVGKFSNGRTADANNEMIVAVREGKEITIDGRTLVEAYDERKLRNGYVF